MLDSIKLYLKLLNKQERKKVVYILLLVLLGTVIELLAIGSIPLFVTIISDINVLEPYLSTEWYERIASQDVLDLLVYGALVLVVLFLLKALYTIFNGFYQEKFVRNSQYRISVELFRKYIRAPYHFYFNRNSSDLIKNVYMEIFYLHTTFINPLIKGMSSLILAPIIIISLFSVNTIVSLAACIILGIFLTLYTVVTKRKLSRFGKILQTERGSQLKAINQGLSAFKEIRVFDKEHYFQETFNKSTKNMTRISILTNLINRINNPYLEFVSILGLSIIIFVLTKTNTSLESIISTITFFTVAMLRLKQSSAQILSSYNSIRVHHITVRPIYKDLTEIESSVENEQEESLAFEEGFHFENASYSYPKAKRKAFEDCNLKFTKGKSYGIVGKTGSGKSTMVDVLLGILPLDEGAFYVDDTQITSKNFKAWREKIGYIPQNIYLMDSSVRTNIAFGIPEKDIDDERVWKSLELAQLKEFVEQMDDQLESICGERGINFSGGQRQRLGIARALYSDPDILVMDEATSALDNKTEKSFVKAVTKLKGLKTLIIIAHRLTTVKDCDEILLMSDGKLTDRGTYEQLAQESKAFKELVNGE